MSRDLTGKIDCAEACDIPPGVRLTRVPVPRHAWADVLVCPHCGDAFLALPKEDPASRSALAALEGEEQP